MANMNVVVPLGGLGSRFQKEGYLTRPKPFVPVLGKPMILWVLENLTLGQDDTLIIVYNPNFMNIGHFMREVVGDAFPHCKFVELPGPTRGAAETVLFGLKGLDEALRKRPTVLVDGDTFYTADVVGRFRSVADTHNAVFCFHDTQPKPMYSYVKLDAADDVVEVREKVKISDWANSGCYCFRDGMQLAAECEALIEANTTQASQDGAGEFYTSGVIAAMIAKREPFRALKIESGDMHVLGTPSQVEEFCAKWPSQPRQRFVFDLEGVLIVGFKGAPVARNIELAQRLKAQGHTIVVHSTRAWGMEKKTWSFFEEHNIPCDELVLGKPRGNFYIGGPSTLDGLLADLDKQSGFHPTDIKASSARRGYPNSAQPLRVKRPKMQKIGTLHPGSEGVTCLVKIIDDMKEVESIKKGSSRTFWEVTCGDETGKVVLSLTDSQKAGMAKDKVLVVRNGHVKMIKGFIRLIIDKWGKLDMDPGNMTVDSVGEHNVSSTEYELVET